MQRNYLGVQSILQSTVHEGRSQWILKVMLAADQVVGFHKVNIARHDVWSTKVSLGQPVRKRLQSRRQAELSDGYENSGR